MPKQSALRPGVFLDRDGTVAEEAGYLNHASRFRIFSFAAAAIRRLNRANSRVIAVTIANDLSHAADWILRQQT